MIAVLQLGRGPMYLNADLLESVEATPYTVLTMVGGRRIVVAESPEEIAEHIVEFRASVLVSPAELRGATNSLSPVHWP